MIPELRINANAWLKPTTKLTRRPVFISLIDLTAISMRSLIRRLESIDPAKIYAGCVKTLAVNLALLSDNIAYLRSASSLVKDCVNLG